MKDQERLELLEQIKNIKNCMIDVATRNKDINDIGDYYKRIYGEVNKVFFNMGISNPNPHRELRDFYNYWKNNGLDSYQSRRNYVNGLYKNIELGIYDNKEIKDNKVDFWTLFKQELIDISKKLFDDGHYSSSVLEAMKLVNNKVKEIVKNSAGQEFDGAPLMDRAFSLGSPIIKLSDLSGQTEKDIQQGYMALFKGAMLAIRNPKAHDYIQLEKEKAIHFLFLANLLLMRLKEAGY
ncbi:MAG: TIGR02391 family protein [Candidatus Absconditabacteria bacterium]|nr:TIGR02391 family protein [Candidatus Absconditabacteria bacterium]